MAFIVPFKSLFAFSLNPREQIVFSPASNYFSLKATFDTRKDKKSLIFVIHSLAAIKFSSVGKL